ncbi:HXXEE domain-containing protein [Clostridium oceanicum]|uniref:HXXEE domain-containing protein n=1 Tax=Clostridium oceanicum TaxID=1543 RepID=A0ABP3UXD6_9CLOT
MRNSYIEWVKDNWQKAAILVLIYVLGSLIPLYSRIDFIEFMILLAFPLYLVHEIEEYILPGGFPVFFNKNLLKVNPRDKIVPVDREVIFWINFIYIWLIIPLFSGLGFINIKFFAWIPYFFFFQAFGHLVMGIKGKMIFNPGIRSSFIFHVPYSIIMINLLSNNGAFTNPYVNLYMFIGFMFNLLLPISAKFIIIPRYHRRLKKH